MKRGVQEERRRPSTDNASMKNVHLVGTLQGLRVEKTCSAAETGGDGRDDAGSPEGDQFRIRRRVLFS